MSNASLTAPAPDHLLTVPAVFTLEHKATSLWIVGGLDWDFSELIITII